MHKIFWVVIVFFSFFLYTDSVCALSSEQAKQNLKILLERRECPRCDLSGLDLTRLDLSRTNLQGADLSFSICNLANFTYADLRGAKLHNTLLIGTDMEGADLRNVDLKGTSMESAFLGEALLDNTGQTDPASAKPLPEVPGDIAGNKKKKPLFIHQTQRKRLVNTAPFSGDDTAGKTPLAPFLFAGKETVVEADNNRRRPLYIAADKKKRQLAATRGGGRVMIHALQQKKRISQQDKQITLLQPLSSGWRRVPADIVERPLPVASVGSDAGKRILASPKPVQQMARSALPESIKNKAKRAQLLRLLKTRACRGCNLAGLDLSGQSFVGADLERADLSGCKLRGADLRQANLRAARLVEAKMQQTRLDGAVLHQADISYADLTGASTSGTDFSGARLTGAVGVDRK